MPAHPIFPATSNFRLGPLILNVALVNGMFVLARLLVSPGNVFRQLLVQDSRVCVIRPLLCSSLAPCPFLLRIRGLQLGIHAKRHGLSLCNGCLRLMVILPLHCLDLRTRPLGMIQPHEDHRHSPGTRGGWGSPQSNTKFYMTWQERRNLKTKVYQRNISPCPLT